MRKDFTERDPGTLAVLAADMGGTRLRAAVVGADGSIALRAERATLPERGPEAVAGDLAAPLSAVAADAAVAGMAADPSVAVAATGPIDADGRLVDPSNLGPAYFGFPLADELAARLGRPVRVGLDTHIALLGEAAHGALVGVRDAVYVTVSTGVGGAVMARGRLIVGAHGLAGEVGHLPVMVGGPRCGCGARGHLEAIASGPAIAAAGDAAARAGRSATLARAAAVAPGGRPSARDVWAAAAAGDAVAAAILARAQAALGRAIAGLVALLDPERVVLGGGVILGDPGPWLDAVRRQVAAGGQAVPGSSVFIVPAALGDDAGLVGCRPFLLGSGVE